MAETLDITLQPEGRGREYVDPHSQDVSKTNDVGKTIKFCAEYSSFAVVIPNADEIFVTDKDTWYGYIPEFKCLETPVIKSGITITEQEYYVYCEKTQDWADKPYLSPPRIIIRP